MKKKISDLIKKKNKQKIVLRNPNSVRPWQHVLEALSGYITFSIKLKKNRLKILKAFKSFKFIKVDLSKKKKLFTKLKNQNFDVVSNARK